MRCGGAASPFKSESENTLQTREGVRAETEHYNCILRAEAIHSGLNMARKTLVEMMENKMGKHVRPNAATFNALIEARSFAPWTAQAVAQ